MTNYFDQGLAALLLSLLGAGSLAQAADEAQSEGKIEARSKLFAKDRRSVHQLEGTSEPQAPTPWRKIADGGALGRLPLLQVTTSRAAASMR